MWVGCAWIDDENHQDCGAAYVANANERLRNADFTFKTVCLARTAGKTSYAQWRRSNGWILVALMIERRKSAKESERERETPFYTHSHREWVSGVKDITVLAGFCLCGTKVAKRFRVSQSLSGSRSVRSSVFRFRAYCVRAHTHTHSHKPIRTHARIRIYTI